MNAPPRRLDSVHAELAELRRRGLLRELRPLGGPQGPELCLDGRPVVNFCSNDYLGLAAHPALAEAAARAAAEEGYGSGAARLIAGNLTAHRTLEARLAEWMGTEAALLFGSGYQANVGVLSALCGPDDAIYSDQLNHASLIDGARLSRAAVHVYPHGDLDALERLLSEGGRYRRRLVASESLFSMDGDRGDVATLVAISRRHDAFLHLDEAHALGALGPGGRGIAAEVFDDAGGHIDLRLGTFGKALGGYGAFVAGSRALIELLVNRARSFVFTTALPVPVAAAARAGVELAAGEEGERRRARLARNVARLRAGLAQLGLAAGAAGAHDHIVPLPIGGAEATMAMSARLLERGLYVQGIRPPTVPEGGSRLRIALSAAHEDRHLDALLNALAELRESFA